MGNDPWTDNFQQACGGLPASIERSGHFTPFGIASGFDELGVIALMRVSASAPAKR